MTDANNLSSLVLPRRRLLQLSALSGLGFLLNSCGTNLGENEVYQLSRSFNEKVENLLFNPQKLIPEFSIQEIESEALLVNTFDFTPEINPRTFRLQVNGEVAQPLSLSLNQIAQMPLTSMIIRHVCVEGWAAIVQWGGVRLADIAALTRPKENVRYVYFKSADGYYESWDLASSLHPQTLLAYQKNGQALPIENGAPLRLASPLKLGYKQSKWITQITFLSQKPKNLGYWEDQGYEWFAGL